MAIINKFKSTTGAGVAILAEGELATNTADGTLYVGDGTTNVLLATTGQEVLPVGTDEQTLWNNAGTWEATSNVTIDSSGNLGAVDITASGDLGAVDVTASGEVTSDHGVSIGAKEIGSPTQAITDSIITVTQAEYDAIGTPDANTLYIIVG